MFEKYKLNHAIYLPPNPYFFFKSELFSPILNGQPLPHLPPNLISPWLLSVTSSVVLI